MFRWRSLMGFQPHCGHDATSVEKICIAKDANDETSAETLLIEEDAGISLWAREEGTFEHDGLPGVHDRSLVAEQGPTSIEASLHILGNTSEHIGFCREGIGDNSDTDLKDIPYVNQSIDAEEQQKMQSDGSGSNNSFRPPIAILTCLVCFVGYIRLYLQASVCVVSFARRLRSYLIHTRCVAGCFPIWGSDAVESLPGLVFSAIVWYLLLCKVGYSTLVLWGVAGSFVYASGKCIRFLFQKCIVGYVWLCTVLEALEPNTDEPIQLSDDSKVELVDAQSFMRPPVISSKLRRQLNLRS